MPEGLRLPIPAGPGDHIRVVSPGLPTLAHLPERGRRAEKALRDMGFEVSYSAHAFSLSADGITSGSPQERAQDLMDAFQDPAVDAIIISDSGTGSREMLPLLDDELIAANPKPFIGFCDTVYLHHYLALRSRLSSYYGCSLMVHLGDVGGPFPEASAYLVDALAAEKPLECRPVGLRACPLETWHVPEIEGARRVRDYPGGWTWLRAGAGRGPLYGGEISQLPGVIAEFELSYASTVLFWDISEEQTRPVDQLLEQLCASADLTDLAGMIIGANPRMSPAAWIARVRTLLDRLLPEASYPVMINADLSHMAPSWTVPFGEEVVLDDERGIIFPRKG